MENPPMISVIIPTYKSPDALDLCLESAIKGQNKDNQIIIVVDGHYDLNKEVLEKHKDSIDVLNLEQNQGLCRGTNLGVYNAKHEHILIVNDDNVFPYGWDLNLKAAFEASGGVLAPNQIEPYQSMFPQFHIKDLGRTIKDFDLKKFWEYEIDLSKDKLENNGSTLPIFMLKVDYLRVGGWDENYEMGVVADWDFFLKCQLSGLKMQRTYNPHFYHFVSLETKKSPESMLKRQQAENDGHRYAAYKWRTSIKHNPQNNLKYI